MFKISVSEAHTAHTVRGMTDTHTYKYAHKYKHTERDGAERERPEINL